MARVTEEPEVLEREGVEPTPAEARGAAETTDVREAPVEVETFREEQYEAGPDIHDDRGAEAVRKRPLYRRPAFLIIAALVLIFAVIYGLRYWAYARAHETTDDAFVDGHIVQVSPKVSGYVAKVYVKDNQEVKEGDLVAELDARDYEARLEAAKAALAAGLAREREAQAGVSLTRANTRANVQQASGVVQQARSGVESARAAAAAERSKISQAGAGVATAQAGVATAQAQVAAAEAEANRASADVARYQELFSKDEVSRQRLDQAIAEARTAAANLDAARRRVAAAEAQVAEARAAEAAQAEQARRAQTQVGGAQAGVGEALGRAALAGTGPQQIAVSQAQAETAGASIEQLRAAVEQAELELSYTKLYAPETGRVTRKAVEEGALVQPGQPLMAVVSGDIWVTANFKETQLGDIHPGQPVEVTVDAYSGRTFKARVESIQMGTGARFSLIPPENATGNYVKVVQRVPVKIVFEPNQLDPNQPLAPGMSVTPEVQVR
ncbi:MAG TPA: HlyD family secretion protein [Pyrinomonadaceae bacterium]|jgi:membrane fusion protein (multidrug efflux system)|nr:HlyD family secretion protein [Pyrinomonadaceae bacterium]